jgi:hypothetical protein
MISNDKDQQDNGRDSDSRAVVDQLVQAGVLEEVMARVDGGSRRRGSRSTVVPGGGLAGVSSI